MRPHNNGFASALLIALASMTMDEPPSNSTSQRQAAIASTTSQRRAAISSTTATAAFRTTCILSLRPKCNFGNLNLKFECEFHIGTETHVVYVSVNGISGRLEKV